MLQLMMSRKVNLHLQMICRNVKALEIQETIQNLSSAGFLNLSGSTYGIPNEELNFNWEFTNLNENH